MEIVSELRVKKICQIGLGEGCNSILWLAEDEQLQQHVVVKEMHVSAFKNPGDYFAEAQRLFKAKSPRIVPIQYACVDVPAEVVRIVMPYFMQGSLQNFIDKFGPLTTREIIRYGQQILAGLQHIHSVGLLHLDLKPNNCLIGDNSELMISDFGQSIPVGLLGVANAPKMYCRAYPPEVILYKAVTRQSDIYQVGYSLYRMANGTQLYEAQANPLKDKDELKSQIVAGKFPRRDKFLPHVPRRLRTIIRKCLAVDPATRYQTPEEVLGDLAQCATGLDWKIHIESHRFQWTRPAELGSDEIFMELSASGWITSGYTTRGSNRRMRNAWCSGPFKNQTECDKSLKAIFENEG